MRDLVLRSLLVAMFVIPFVAARERNAMRGLKKAIALFVVFNVLYMLALKFVYPLLV